MNEELAILVDKYSSNNKYVDKAFVDRVCLDLVDFYNLHDYLKDVTVNDFDIKSGGASSYHPHNKTMSIELCSSKKYLRKLDERFLKDHYYWYNLYVLMSILHEMEHVKQEKLLENRFDTIESSLIYLNNILDSTINDKGLRNKILGHFKIIRYGSYYTRNHDKAPIERLANIRSFKDIVDIINIIDKEDLDAIAVYKGYTLDLMLDQIRCGYKLDKDKTNSPSLDYLRGMKSTNNKELINRLRIFKSDSLSLTDKLTYGLDLDKEEYDYIQDDIKTLKLFNIR